MAQSTVPDVTLDTRDGDQITAQAIGNLPTEMSDRSNSNPAVVLLEASGYQVDKNLYQINRWPSAVVAHIMNVLGNELLPARSATVSQQFTLSSPRTQATTIAAGSEVSVEDGDPVFATTADLTIAARSQPPGTITFTSGSTAVVGVYTAGAGTVTVNINNTAVVGVGTNFTANDVGLGLLTVGGNYYEIVAVAGALNITISPAGVATEAGVTYTTGAYFQPGTTWTTETWQIQPRGSGSWYSIASVTDGGNLVLSASAAATSTGVSWDVGPITGSVAARATTTGTDTNVGSGTLTTLVSSVNGVASTTNAADATGGAAVDTVAEAVARAASAFSARSVAVETDSYAYFAQQVMGTGSRAEAASTMNITTTANGYVTVALLGADWTAATPVTAADRGAVLRDLQGRVFQGSTVVDTPAVIVERTPAMAVWRTAGYDTVQVQVNIAGAINTYLNPSTFPWGRELYVTDLIDVVEGAEGVDRVHNLDTSGAPAVACIGATYNAATPATLALVNGNATANTANTGSFTANRTWVYDDIGNAVYLIISIAAGVSVTFDRVFAGATLTATKPYWTTEDDDLNSGAGSEWLRLAYSNLSVDTDSPPASVIVLGEA
jgi:hypothetical protein